MNMVELAAHTLQDVESQVDEPVTDPIVFQNQAHEHLNRALSKLDEETAKGLDAKIDELRRYDAIVSYTEGFQRGIQFIVTAMANGKKY